MSTILKNPKWKYTWEAHSHLPILKLFLFNNTTNLKTHCFNLNSVLNLQISVLKTTWYEHEHEESEVFVLVVPLPKVLIDGESPVQYKVLDDHIEVKVVLLLPVDHPIFVNFDTKMSLNENGNLGNDKKNVSIDTDLKRLCLESEGVCFYCRSCSAQLTRPIKSFSEMPSTDWSEVADNWFGGCCCSFGGIGDKMVAKYANSYASVAGTCLLSTTFVLIYKDDLVRCKFSGGDGNKEDDIVADLGNANSSEETMLNNGVKHVRVANCDNLNEDTFGSNDSRGAEVAENAKCHPHCPVKVNNGEKLSVMSTASDLSSNGLSASGCCGDGTHNLIHIAKNGYFDVSGTGLNDQPLIKTSELHENQKSFLNGFLGDIFMAKSSHLSEDVCWVEFLCPQCSTFIGAYPADNGRTILDGGIRLFKCYVSTCLPASGSDDLFRKYTLERMFTNQLIENARTELSYRTVIRDRKTKSAMLQIVLLNPDSFLQSGYCSDTNNKLELAETVDLSSATQVLFADCSENGVSGIRMVEEWVKKNQADEVYMFTYQIEELMNMLDSAKDMFPLSCTSLQGLSLSSLMR